MYVIDRIEKDYVVCEKKGTCYIVYFNRSQFPDNIAEGMTFEYKDNKVTIINDSETHNRISDKMNQLWK